MTETWRQPARQVIEQFESSAESGLSKADVRVRRRRHGPNRLRESKSRPAWRILTDQFKSIVVVLLMSAAIAAALFERLVEALAIGAALLVNGLIGFVMEWRATRAMEALRRMGKTRVRVRRDGSAREIAADALVPGDIVLLEAGDMIAADLRLIEANRLQCDETTLTGESVAVDKTTEPLEASDIPLAERTNMVFKGTAVTQGSGAGVTVATGMNTELGHISDLVEQAEMAITPLEKRLDVLGRRLVWLTLIVAVVVAGSGFLAGKDLLVMVETAIALAIAAVPEGLPVVATLALAQGMRRMARRNAVVKRLSAVEALGATNLIFTDKTGTLTENHMTLARLALEKGTLAVDADSRNVFTLDGESVEISGEPALRLALEVGVLCNNADLHEDGAMGDPTEIAFLEAAKTVDMTREALLEENPEVREVSFDPQVKMMATFHRRDGHYRVAVKGAPEAVIPVCKRLFASGGEEDPEDPLDDQARERWLSRSQDLAAGGLRVLALAHKNANDEWAEPYQDLTLLGLAGLYDPPREGIVEAIEACQRAGIRIVMGTGDHGATARAIAAEIGLDDVEAEPVESKRLTKMDSLDDEQRRQLLERRVFARVSPEQKLDLVSLYQEAGRVVGMTGDGVNDAPALKKADIGIAMGKRGTEVAREAADMVLKDDAFATIVAAIEHGRTIFRNIRRFIVYLLSGNLGEIMAVSAAALVAAPIPLLPLQILYINFVSDVMPALALGLSRSEPGVMRQPPRDPEEPILLRRHWAAIFGYGALIAASALAAFALALLWLNMDTAHAVTVSFLTFGFARLWHVFNMRSAGSRVFVNDVTRNVYVWVALLVGVVLLLASAYVPVFARVLSVHVSGVEGWLLSLSFSVLPLVIVQLMKMGGVLWESESSN